MTNVQLNHGFHIHVTEQGAGVPVILLHGFCGSGGYFASIKESLSKHCRVILPDLRGHGKSAAPNGPYTIEEMADDIIQVADKLQLNQFVLLGHSLGGYIALSAAERYADRLLGFGLIHSNGYPDTDEGKAGRLQAIEKIQTEGMAAFINALVPTLFNPDRLDALKGEVQAAVQIGYHTPPQGAIGASLAMRERKDRRQVMEDTDVPLLLVAGRKDLKMPPEKLFTTSREGVSSHIIENAGHMSMQETPEELVSIIQSFVKERVEAV
ncbi:alpha/beta fold hydrolase [Paenibacillus aquistagni]|uniref:alpha/beta fold hydrolase n=1 Tax=Paenibacillus aquistagni TaxID=1852522 RepID=UPI000B511F33|nr:alpha/beta hydrolase [Paenibacillus aquistagni]